MIHDTWENFNITGSSPMNSVLEKLNSLQESVKLWQKKKIRDNRKELVKIQEQLDYLQLSMSAHFLREHIRVKIQKMEHRKKEVLMIEEVTWRLKSIAL